MKTQRHTIVAGNGLEVRRADGENASFSHSHNPNNVFSQIFIFAFVRKYLDSNATLVCTAISLSVFPRFANGGFTKHHCATTHYGYAAVHNEHDQRRSDDFYSSPPANNERISFSISSTYYPSDNITYLELWASHYTYHTRQNIITQFE